MEEKYYYANCGFYLASIINTAYASGLTDDDLSEISEEEYNLWFSPPDGKYGAWVDGKPVLLDIPAVDYVAIAESKRTSLISEANSATYTSSLKIAMGRKLTDAESKSVNEWLDYIDDLVALDLSTAPDVDWPEKPQ